MGYIKTPRRFRVRYQRFSRLGHHWWVVDTKRNYVVARLSDETEARQRAQEYEDGLRPTRYKRRTGSTGFRHRAGTRQNPSIDPKELAAGIQVEMEHTDDPKVAKAIALDHLRERPHYYSELARCMPGEVPGMNPPSLDDIQDMCPGVDLLEQFAEDYPESAAGTLEITLADKLYHGRNVIWRGTEGEMIRMRKEYLRSMPGNIWDPCKIAGIVAALQELPEKVVLDPGYGVPNVIGLVDVKESIEYADEDPDAVLTTGDEELDRYLVDPDEVLDEYEEDGYDRDNARKVLNERLQEAVANDEGDLGAIEFQVRNGNHRTFGALLSGEPYVWLLVDDNTLQDLRRHPEREGNQRIIDALE